MPNTFADLIQSSTHGEINSLATNEMETLINEMNNAMRALGGKQKGTLTLKVAFTLEASGVIDTTAEVTTKRPPRAKPRAFLFMQRDGSLGEEDTRQGSLFEGDKAAARDVSTPSDAKVRDISDHRAAAANDRA